MNISKIESVSCVTDKEDQDTYIRMIKACLTANEETQAIIKRWLTDEKTIREYLSTDINFVKNVELCLTSLLSTYNAVWGLYNSRGDSYNQSCFDALRRVRIQIEVRDDE